MLSWALITVLFIKTLKSHYFCPHGKDTGVQFSHFPCFGSFLGLQGLCLQYQVENFPGTGKGIVALLIGTQNKFLTLVLSFRFGFSSTVTSRIAAKRRAVNKYRSSRLADAAKRQYCFPLTKADLKTF